MSIQSSVNSMIGSASRAVMAVKGYQELKAKKAAGPAEKAAEPQAPKAGASPQAQARAKAEQSAANAIEEKKTQRRKFMDYLKQEPTSLGGTVGQFPPTIQKQIASQYTKSQRKRLMDMRDAEAKDGEHR